MHDSFGEHEGARTETVGATAKSPNGRSNVLWRSYGLFRSAYLLEAMKSCAHPSGVTGSTTEGTHCLDSKTFDKMGGTRHKEWAARTSQHVWLQEERRFTYTIASWIVQHLSIFWSEKTFGLTFERSRWAAIATWTEGFIGLQTWDGS